MSTMLWVTVPGGLVGTGAERLAVLRVLVTPKLDGGTLASNGMDPWPPTGLTTATLVVDFAASPNGPAQQVQVMPPHIRPQPGVWEAFFPSDTIITPPRPHSQAAPQVAIERTSLTAAAINNTFATAAAMRLRLDNDDDRKKLDRVVREQLMTNWSDEPPPRPQQPPQPPPSFQPPEFHQTIAKLREHPAVLRALGLIIEFTIPAAALPLQSGVICVRWPSKPSTLPDIVSLWTQFDDLMLPATTQNISSGMVTLTDDRWKIVNVDVDVAARRLRSAARASASGAGSATFPLPVLRTAGLMLVRSGRQADFDTRRRVATANSRRASTDPPLLTADDLVLGYRIDVKRQDRDWESLSARDATYAVKATVPASATQITIGDGPAREEGHVKAFAAVDDGSGQLRADEVVTRWTGWNLTVPLPATAQDNPLNPGMPFAFRWEFHVPKGTLPPLRFGKSYSIRARVADLAGGGLDVADPAAARCFIGPAIYQRYEPIASPLLALPQSVDATALGPGESIEQVVMRDDSGAGTTDVPSRTRVLTVPREPLRLAEQHGELDDEPPAQIVDLIRQAIAVADPGAPPSRGDVLFPDIAADGVCAFPRREPGGLDVVRTDRAWGGKWPNLDPKEVVLRERGMGDSILAWESAVPGADNGDRLVVRLAKAEQLTLEFSSPVKDSCRPHFAITAVPSFPAESQASASAGRHPMITPARAVTFTYTVRRPLADPAGTLTAQRSEDQTFAQLVPFPALLTIDATSTGELEVDATWSEPNGADDTTKSFTDVPVQTVIINRGDQTLKEIRHEFGDTRHRLVTYTATAVSRFRPFYAATEDNTAFLAKATLAAPVVVPSCARPPQLDVLSTRPAFKWQDAVDPMPAFKLVRQRLGGYLRLELDGPWYQTGQGEQFAVIVGTDNNPPAEMWPLLTQLGLDPTREPAGLPLVRFPTSEAFAEAAGAVRAVVDRDSGNTVMAVPFQPWCRDGRWYADVALPTVATSTFWPFVQLAVARYQPDSLAGLELSAIARTEMVQLMPPRTLTIRRTGNDVFVSLDGPVSGVGTGFPSFEVFLDRLQLPPGISADGIDLTALDPLADSTPAWLTEGEPQGGSLGTKEFHFAIQPGGGLARVRIAEICTISAAGLPPEDPVSVRTEFSDVVILPQP